MSSGTPLGAHDVERDRDHFGPDPVAADHGDPVEHDMAPTLAPSGLRLAGLHASDVGPFTKKPPTWTWTVASERRAAFAYGITMTSALRRASREV